MKLCKGVSNDAQYHDCGYNYDITYNRILSPKWMRLGMRLLLIMQVSVDVTSVASIPMPIVIYFEKCIIEEDHVGEVCPVNSFWPRQ